MLLGLAGCSDGGASTAPAQPQPPPPARYEGIVAYDESADAASEVAAARATANEVGKLLLISFGANWCTDCRAFEAACRDPEIAAAIDRHFVTAKVDVGNWDKNPDVVQAWGNPIEGGIPAVVVARPDGEVLFSTKAGQLARARHMGRAAFVDFFDQLALLGAEDG